MTPSATKVLPTNEIKSVFVAPRPERYFTIFTTPVGEMLLVSDGVALVELRLPLVGPWDDLPDEYVQDETPLKGVMGEIEAYFRGELTAFTTPLAPSGTPFQLEVWQALLGIEYGTTKSYGEIARNIGRPKAPRAVGMANHVNPIALIIPCHRVIGANGSLVGYGGGLPLKTTLLQLESETVVKRDHPSPTADER